MSSNGSNGKGHQHGRSNGALKKIWDLKKDGILWKKVIQHSTDAFEKEANRFVAQLQYSVQPDDALQGLLLDRMAASYLRKQLLLEMEAEARVAKRAKAMGGNVSAEELRNPKKRKIELHVEALLSPDVLRYEGLLDQGFHRDLILLMKLKESAPVLNSPDTKSQQSVIENGRSNIIDQL